MSSTPGPKDPIRCRARSVGTAPSLVLMRRRTPQKRTAPAVGYEPSTEPARDQRWSADMRLACQSSAVFLAVLLALDAAAGRLNGPRLVMWAVLASLMFALLLPPRVMAGPGWLASRGLGRERLVRTDRLVLVRWSHAGVRQLVLRDSEGEQVEVDTGVLRANPALWHHVRTGMRVSLAQGSLRRGESAVRDLARHIDDEAALAIFRASGLEL